MKNSKLDRQRPPHFPFEDPPFRLSMGLLKIPEAEWFEIFDLQERALQMAEKKSFLPISRMMFLSRTLLP